MTAPVPISPYPLRWFALAAVLVADVMDQLDATIVATTSAARAARSSGSPQDTRSRSRSA
jgi:hypothetical protein